MTARGEFSRSCVVALAVLATACGRSAAPATTPASLQPTSAPPAPHEPVGVGDGFYLDYPKWMTSGAGTNTGLVASYTWGATGAARKVTANDGGTYWRLIFPDQPKADDVAHIELTYSFSITDQDKKTIQTAVDAVIAEAIGVVGKALRATPAADFTAAVAKASDSIVTAAKPLAAFRSADNTSGQDVVLSSLGFTKQADGSWQPGAQTVDKLRALAVDGVENNVAALKRTIDNNLAALGALPPSPGANPCVAAVASVKSDANTAQASLKPCVAQLTARYRDSLGGAAPATPITAALQELASASTTPLESDADINKMEDAIAAIGSQRPQLTPTYEQAAVVYAWTTMKLTRALSRRLSSRGPIAASLVSRVELLVHDEIGSTVVQGGKASRPYDIATGVIYVNGVQDAVMPILVAACPFAGGCLRTGEAIWNIENKWRTLSIDLGVRGSTLNKREDPRNAGAFPLLYGASWNPYSFLRVSGGFYSFQNAQTDNWCTTTYLGATLNVLSAVEVLGVLGLSPPSAPKLPAAK